MFDRVTVTDDLVDCRGDVVASRGTVLSPQSIADVARRAQGLPRRLLEETALAEDVEVPLAERGYRHLFGNEGVRDAVRRAVLQVALPEVLLDELLAIRRSFPALHEHAFATAAVSVRMLLCAVGEARGVPDLAAAALLHDLGMRHLPARLLRQRERLSSEDALRIASHPLTGAYHLAARLGPHPAVAAAHAHHWRCGQGYPGLEGPPSRSIEVISIASAFAALTQTRPFRPAAYDARGASDVLAAEAKAGYADGNTVKLLVHALRGGRGDPRGIRFGRERAGHGPDATRYVHVAAPARSPV
jgi:HD-GYP domain-containing protein (c-di-GMP phosphodiesterase class II)